MKHSTRNGVTKVERSAGARDLPDSPVKFIRPSRDARSIHTPGTSAVNLLYCGVTNQCHQEVRGESDIAYIDAGVL